MRENGVDSGFILESELVRIGRYRCTPWASVWREENQISSGPLMVFPSRALRVEEVDSEPVVANTNSVVFHNKAPYRRWLIDERGEDSIYVAFAPGVYTGIMREIDACCPDDPDRPFTFTHAPVDAASFLAQRRIAARVLRGDPVDALEAEETMLRLAGRLLRAGREVRGNRPRAARDSTRSAHLDLARAAEDELSRIYRQRVTLGALARRVHSSPFHLARVFRASTGMSVHSYLQGLRLRAGLLELGEKRPLSDIGLGLGFSSHAHFTTAFKREFGIAPSHERAGG